MGDTSKISEEMLNKFFKDSWDDAPEDVKTRVDYISLLMSNMRLVSDTLTDMHLPRKVVDPIIAGMLRLDITYLTMHGYIVDAATIKMSAEMQAREIHSAVGILEFCKEEFQDAKMDSIIEDLINGGKNNGN